MELLNKPHYIVTTNNAVAKVVCDVLDYAGYILGCDFRKHYDDDGLEQATFIIWDAGVYRIRTTEVDDSYVQRPNSGVVCVDGLVQLCTLLKVPFGVVTGTFARKYAIDMRGVSYQMYIGILTALKEAGYTLGYATDKHPLTSIAIHTASKSYNLYSSLKIQELCSDPVQLHTVAELRSTFGLPSLEFEPKYVPDPDYQYNPYKAPSLKDKAAHLFVNFLVLVHSTFRNTVNFLRNKGNN